LEISQAWVLFFWHLLTAGFQDTLKLSGAMKVCPAVTILYELFCRIYDRMEEEDDFCSIV
jgi:hypothetical protein